MQLLRGPQPVQTLTRMARAHNTAERGTGRTMSGGLDSRAMEIPRRFFGAARKLEGAGSLTILATILVDTGSKMDDIIFQEFKGTGNMELVLSRDVSQQRIFPAIDVLKSGTRKEELLLGPEELDKMRKLRGELANLGTVSAAQALVELLQSHSTNQGLLASI